MKLIEIRVQHFRNILDSTPVAVQPDVTCLVGKNESGKTAFLEAVYRLNPARPNVSFSVAEQYPAWLEKHHRLQGKDLDVVVPVVAVFELEAPDQVAIVERFGVGTLVSNRIIVSRTYKGGKVLSFQTDEHKAVLHAIRTAVDLPVKFAKEARQAPTFEQLNRLVGELQGREGEEPHAAAAALKARITAILGGKQLQDAVLDALDARTPQFFYFAEYSTLPGKVRIRELLQANPASLSDDLLTARALLQLAATDKAFLLNPDYQRRKRELENVGNALTRQVLDYWSQNRELRVDLDLTLKQEPTPQGQQAVIDELHIRMWDDRHWLSLPFEQRSSGFQWFFSFLGAFSEYEYKDDPLIILLDEPALGLHARAQKDFLRFIDERLSPKHQVIYTTHSPFMVQPDKLDRIRLVEDRGPDRGAKVTSEALTTDSDTLFPLQGALGYDMAQHLFVAPHNLVVEGVSDFTYLTAISDFLKAQQRAHLDDRWSIVPVGGADLIPTFVALLGAHLQVTVLIDSQKAGHQRLQNLADSGILGAKRIVTIGGVLGRKLADIEDLFEIDDYLVLFNRAFHRRVKATDLKGTDPLVSRIARHQGVERYDRGRPAEVLLRHRDNLLPKLSNATLEHFEGLFKRINATLG